MFKLRNPLPRAIRDTERTSVFYRDHKLVPFAGTTKASSHIFLKLLNDLYELSPSHSACIEDKKTWSFEGDLQVIKNERVGLKLDQELTVSDEEAVLFADFLESKGIKLPDIIELTQRFYVDFEKTGNAYIHYFEAGFNGETYVSIDNVDPMQVMYLQSEPGEPKTIVVSDDFFTYNDSFEKEPRLIRVYPSFSVGAGFRETIIHVKNKRDYSEWYGRPHSLASVYWQFIEWVHGNLVSKIANSELGIKALLMLQSPDVNAVTQARDQNAAFAVYDIGEALRRLGSNRGNHEEMESLGVFEYPQGVDAPKLETFAINRDERWSRMILEKASDIIFGTHRWSKIINGWERATSGIGGNVLIDEFNVNNVGTIKPNQRKWERVWKQIFDILIESTGSQEFAHFGIMFEDRIGSMIDSLSGGEQNTEDVITTNIIDGGGSDPVQQDPQEGDPQE